MYYLSQGRHAAISRRRNCIYLMRTFRPHPRRGSHQNRSADLHGLRRGSQRSHRQRQPPHRSRRPFRRNGDAFAGSGRSRFAEKEKIKTITPHFHKNSSLGFYTGRKEKPAEIPPAFLFHHSFSGLRSNKFNRFSFLPNKKALPFPGRNGFPWWCRCC